MMTGFFLKHSVNSLKCFSSGSSLSRRRAIHFTSVVHKKTAKLDIEDLFEDETVSDLFTESIVDKTTTENEVVTTTTKSGGSSTPVERSTTTQRRDPFKRSALLKKHVAFMKHYGDSKNKQPKIRSRNWLTMMQLAKDEEDMTKVVDLLPNLYARGVCVLPDLFAEEFVRRCEELGCQHLALEVFGNYAKYNITLTPNAGRWLIHSIHVLHPLKDLLIAASLFPIFNLSLAEDLVSASMFTAACFKHDTPHSRAVANFLLPEIKKMVEEKRLLTTPVSEVEKNRQLKWVDWSLKKINKFVKKSSGEPLVSVPVVQVQPSVVQL